jgi:hypothetical protein
MHITMLVIGRRPNQRKTPKDTTFPLLLDPQLAIFANSSGSETSRGSKRRKVPEQVMRRRSLFTGTLPYAATRRLRRGAQKSRRTKEQAHEGKLPGLARVAQGLTTYQLAI